MYEFFTTIPGPPSSQIKFIYLSSF